MTARRSRASGETKFVKIVEAGEDGGGIRSLWSGQQHLFSKGRQKKNALFLEGWFAQFGFRGAPREGLQQFAAVVVAVVDHAEQKVQGDAQRVDVAGRPALGVRNGVIEQFGGAVRERSVVRAQQVAGAEAKVDERGGAAHGVVEQIFDLDIVVCDGERVHIAQDGGGLAHDGAGKKRGEEVRVVVVQVVERVSRAAGHLDGEASTRKVAAGGKQARDVGDAAAGVERIQFVLPVGVKLRCIILLSRRFCEQVWRSAVLQVEFFCDVVAADVDLAEGAFQIPWRDACADRRAGLTRRLGRTPPSRCFFVGHRGL